VPTIPGVHTKAIGEISEAVILAEFLKLGIPVLRPWGDNQRYDMVVEVGGQFLRVQCKTAHPVEVPRTRGCVRFNARSTNRTNGAPTGYRNAADVFAAYAPSTGQVYVIPVDEVPETEVWLRVEPARSNQRARIRLAEEHTLAAWAARLLGEPAG
jgi:PD-(D/E)XK endonuclease